MGLLAALAKRWNRRHGDHRAPPNRGPDAELLAGVALSAHAVRRFVERGPEVPRGRSPEAALAQLVLSGRASDRPTAWFRGRRTGAAFYIVVDGHWVLPVAHGRASGIVRRGMRPWVATTFVARPGSSGRRTAVQRRPIR